MEAEPTRGFTVSRLDFKIRLLDSESRDFGFVVGARPPGGGGPFREKHAQPFAVLAFDQALSKTVSLTAKAGGGYSSSSEGEQFAILLGGVCLSVTTSNKVSLYGEAYFWSRIEPGGLPVQSLSAGIEYFLTKRVSLDFPAGLGFGRTSPDW